MMYIVQLFGQFDLISCQDYTLILAKRLKYFTFKVNSNLNPIEICVFWSDYCQGLAKYGIILDLKERLREIFGLNWLFL